jgi:hypothetical protein
MAIYSNTINKTQKILNMKNKIFILVAVLFSFGANAQKNVTLTIKHMLGTSPFAFNQAATNDLNNNLDVSRIDYYMSGFTIIHDGGMQTPVPASTIVFVEGDNNLVAGLGSYNVTSVEGIKFSIGVPAAVNNLDPAQWTAPHPLSPKSPSMHWGWSAGFRFVAIEGKAGSSLSTTYQMHGLGNANYFQQTVMATGVTSGNEVLINLDADYTEALKGIDVTQGPIDHGVDATDLDVLKNFRDFVFSPGTGFTPTAVSNFEKEIDLNIFPNPSTGNVRITLDNTGKTVVTSAQVFDISGRMINEISLVNQNEANVHFDAKGIYFVRLNSYGINLGSKKVVVQ